MPQNLSQKLINSHLVDDGVTEGPPITLKIDQTLTQDATGIEVACAMRLADDRIGMLPF